MEQMFRFAPCSRQTDMHGSNMGEDDRLVPRRYEKLAGTLVLLALAAVIVGLLYGLSFLAGD